MTSKTVFFFPLALSTIFFLVFNHTSVDAQSVTTTGKEASIGEADMLGVGSPESATTFQKPSTSYDIVNPSNLEISISNPSSSSSLQDQNSVADSTSSSQRVLSQQTQTNTPNNNVDLIITGSTVFNKENLLEGIQNCFSQYEDEDSLKQCIAIYVSQRYADENYITSSLLPDNVRISGRTVEINIIEGTVNEPISIEGEDYVSQSYILERVRRGITTPLRVDRLEEQLRLLRANPLFEGVEASLQPSQKPGLSNLRIDVVEARPVQTTFSIDNYLPPSIGSERFGINLRHYNVTGIGDRFSTSYFRSMSGGLSALAFEYSIPINPMEGTIAARTAFDWTRVTQSEFKAFNIEGESQFYELSFRQPIIRTPREEFTLSFSFSHKSGQTFLFDRRPTAFGIGPDVDGSSRISAIRLAQDYIHRDIHGAWSLQSQFSFGVGWLDATRNDEPIPDSRFISWIGQAQRAQMVGDRHLLIFQTDLQLSLDSLLPAEQYVMGGGQSLRGYRQGIRSGDNGFRFSVEDRITLSRDKTGMPTLQIIPFIDTGIVWNHPDNPNLLPEQTFLLGTGLGLLWELKPGLNLRLDYALPVIDLNEQGSTLQDSGIYFSLSYEM
jgi:hemolysin activation/secretion protein